MAKRKVPSQAASGAETFNDFLVGRQITDGTSALTNTVFALDKVIPQKDSKTFKSNPFSEFLTLENLKENEGVQTTTSTSKKRTDEVRFRGNKKYGDKSLFGSLKSRILVSVTKIIEKFPAGLSVIANSPIGNTPYSVNNITYDDSLVEYISKIGYDETYGARPMKRAIQDKVEDLLSEEVLTNKILEGKNYFIKVEDETIKIVKKGR